MHGYCTNDNYYLHCFTFNKKKNKQIKPIRLAVYISIPLYRTNIVNMNGMKVPCIVQTSKDDLQTGFDDLIINCCLITVIVWIETETIQSLSNAYHILYSFIHILDVILIAKNQLAMATVKKLNQFTEFISQWKEWSMFYDSKEYNGWHIMRMCSCLDQKSHIVWSTFSFFHRIHNFTFHLSNCINMRISTAYLCDEFFFAYIYDDNKRIYFAYDWFVANWFENSVNLKWKIHLNRLINECWKLKFRKTREWSMKNIWITRLHKTYTKSHI